MAQRMKFLLAPASKAEVADCINVSNKLAGIEYKYFDPTENVYSNLRILEFNWNGIGIELWNFPGVNSSNEQLPAVCFMDSCGLIVVSNEAPAEFIQCNNDLFNTEAFPVLWLANDNYYKKKTEQEQALSEWNVELVRYSSPNDPKVVKEFNNWLSTVQLYLSHS